MLVRSAHVGKRWALVSSSAGAYHVALASTSSSATTRVPLKLKEPRQTILTVKPGKTSKSNSSKTESPRMKFLRPAELSKRMKKLCDSDDLEGAVDMLKNAPLDAQNVVVWNTLIHETMQAQRYNMAFSLYTDMKRRGFSPDSRTYGTLFSGYLQIEDWTSFPKQLDIVRKLYTAYQDHTTRVKRHSLSHPDLDPRPTNMYLQILRNAHLRDEMWDVFHHMDEAGPLSPDAFAFTVMLRAQRTESNLSIVPEQANGEATSAEEKSRSSQTRLLWDMAVKSSERNGWEMDEKLVIEALRTLGTHEPADHELALQLAQEFYGLPAAEGSKPLSKFDFTPFAITAILRVCHYAGRYQECVDTADFIIRQEMRARKRGRLLRYEHVQFSVAAQARMAEPASYLHSRKAAATVRWMIERAATDPHLSEELPPQLGIYHTCLSACAAAGDWESALWTVQTMAGTRLRTVDTPSGESKPMRSPRFSVQPTAQSLVLLMQTAATAASPDVVQQCISVMQELGIVKLLTGSSPDSTENERRAPHPREIMYLAATFGNLVSQAGQVISSATERDWRNWDRLLKLSQEALFRCRDDQDYEQLEAVEQL